MPTPPSLSFPLGAQPRGPDEFVPDGCRYLTHGSLGRCLQIDLHDDTEPSRLFTNQVRESPE